MQVDYVRLDQMQLFVCLTYIVMAVCIIYPPSEFVSAGLTVQNLFSGFLGSEQMYFIYYHMKRTSLTVILHSVLPLGFYFWYGCFTQRITFWQPFSLSLFWQYYLLVSIIIPICAAILIWSWSRQRWKRHPIAKTLKNFAQEGNTWQSVASSINVEFRRIDKFATGPVGHRLIVTDSWIILTSTYTVRVAHQTDVHLSLVNSDQHELEYESAQGAQYLTIAVNNIHPSITPFNIRLNAADYSELKEKLQAPVRNARNIVIQQSLSDRFIEAFKQQVRDNPRYSSPPDTDLEPCIGCMQTTSNCKLVRHCAPSARAEGQPPCVQCYCRPMWCLDCLARWFASRQDQSTPERWMCGKSPCPTCRSVFCMLDVWEIQTLSS